MNRRTFLQNSVAGFTAASLSPKMLAAEPSAQAPPSERIQVGVIGAGGRALALNRFFAANPQADVVAIADLDARRLPRAVAEVEKRQGRKPRTTGDFRELTADPKIDALVVGTPDHWHAIPTIMACLAQKDVYVEKPDGHNIVEGQRMIAAMRKHRRIVQMGSQHRSTQRLQSALEYIGTGALGRCLVAKAWESSRQGSIGFPADGQAPPEVDYDMWLGAAPLRPFNTNRFHGRWRWFYDYGTGDLGNDGVHRLDMAFAALQAASTAQGGELPLLPSAVSACGGKWYFNDAQEFPDTLQVNYEYAGHQPKILTYEMRIWAPYSYQGFSEGCAVYGDRGYILIGNSSWQAYGPGGKLVKKMNGGSETEPHVQNFIDCVKSRKKPVCDLETVGHAASFLCHAGNISARVQRRLEVDPKTETFRNDPEANALGPRPVYRSPWELPQV